ncbi:MAG: hypothetical protein ACREX9_05525, partial [Gammaproteobacteria bacterium]
IVRPVETGRPHFRGGLRAFYGGGYRYTGTVILDSHECCPDRALEIPWARTQNPQIMPGEKDNFTPPLTRIKFTWLKRLIDAVKNVLYFVYLITFPFPKRRPHPKLHEHTID